MLEHQYIMDTTAWRLIVHFNVVKIWSTQYVLNYVKLCQKTGHVDAYCYLVCKDLVQISILCVVLGKLLKSSVENKGTFFY